MPPMAAAASSFLSLSLHLRPRPPPHAHRRPPRHAPFLLSPSSNPLPPRHLLVTHGRLPPPWRPSVRARAGTIEVPTLAHPGGAVETDRLPPDVRDRAMDAVDHFSGHITIGDVASRAGLQVDQVERTLQALAADTGGFLEVLLS